MSGKPTRAFSMTIPQFQDPAVNDVIRRLVDEINRLGQQVEAAADGNKRLVSDRQKFRVQSVDKGTYRLEVDTPEGVKTVSLTNLE